VTAQEQAVLAVRAAAVQVADGMTHQQLLDLLIQVAVVAQGKMLYQHLKEKVAQA
jgi:hypothetical protein